MNLLSSTVHIPQSPNNILCLKNFAYEFAERWGKFVIIVNLVFFLTPTITFEDKVSLVES